MKLKTSWFPAEIIMTTHVLHVTKKHYKVKTDSEKECCDVTCTNYAWNCSCPDYQISKKNCQHTDIAEISAGMRELVHPAIFEEPEVAVSDECVYCHSKNVRKHSIRYNKSGNVQRYVCRDCKRKYSLGRTTSNYDIVVEIMDLHLAGKKNAEIAEMLSTKHEDEQITEVLIGYWIVKYKEVIQSYYNTLTRKRMPRWNTAASGFVPDETYKKAKRDIRFLYSILDHDTKVWMAKKIQNKRTEYLKSLSPYKAKQIIHLRKACESISETRLSDRHSDRREILIEPTRLQGKARRKPGFFICGFAATLAELPELSH